MRDMEDGAVVVRRQAEAEPTVVRTEDDDDVASGDSDAEFEFPFVSRETAAGAGGAAAADELFAGGRIRAFYPVFGRVLDEAAPAPAPRAPLGRLFQLEQARTLSVASTSSSSSSSTADAGLDGASPDSYCLWTPGSSASAASSPSRGPTRKSGSTGSVARWRRIGELVVGRSHSDGKEKFLFLSAPPSPARDREHSPASKAKQPPPKGNKAAAAATELDTVAAGRRLSYGGGAKASTGGRRTFLPYRQDLVGLFANVQGLRRSSHPF